MSLPGTLWLNEHQQFCLLSVYLRCWSPLFNNCTTQVFGRGKVVHLFYPPPPPLECCPIRCLYFGNIVLNICGHVCTAHWQVVYLTYLWFYTPKIVKTYGRQEVTQVAHYWDICTICYPLRAITTLQMQPPYQLWMNNLGRICGNMEWKQMSFNRHIRQVRRKRPQCICCIFIKSSHLHRWELEYSSLPASSRTWTQWMQKQIFLITDFYRKQLLYVLSLSW